MDKLRSVVCLLVLMVIFGGLCFGLAVSNPSEEEFIQWAATAEEMNAYAGSAGCATVEGVQSESPENLSNNGTHSFNYGFFTIYASNVKGEREIYLGAVKQFFSLNSLFQNDSETMLGLVEEGHAGLQG